ncbi:Retrotransposon Ty1-copia subclass [Mycena sanguinolenta]|uniref:Retrotransposon Ty1-copia subclass n=1 Tax=Mycena sanguinolenta TaxID=230812 RepID=A0A8H7CDH1_9AGAR|nr:Retrotransposon Ty1-copia subclass [Mycena sanguinolenta]
MSSIASTPLLPIDERLTPFNWPVWNEKVISLMRGRGVAEYPEGKIHRPSAMGASAPTPAADDSGDGADASISTAQRGTPSVTPTAINSHTPSLEEWTLRDGIAAAIIYQNVAQPAAHGIRASNTSREMWAALSLKFGRTSEALKAQAMDRLRAVKLKNGRDLPQHLDKLSTLRDEALRVGAKCDDPVMISVILGSLPNPEFTSSIFTLQKSRFAHEVTNELLSWWDIAYGADRDTEGQGTNALTAGTDQNTSRKSKRCSNCRARFHTADECWARGGGHEGEAPDWWKPPHGKEPRVKAPPTAPAASTATTPTPHTMSTNPPVTQSPPVVNVAHFTSPMPTYVLSAYARDAESETTEDADGGSTLSVSGADDNEFIFRHTGAPPALVNEFVSRTVAAVDIPDASINIAGTKHESPRTFTVLDSGATDVCVVNRKRFLTYEPCNIVGNTANRDGGGFQVAGKGNALFEVQLADGSIRNAVFEALHCPGFAMNLISLPSLDKRGLKGEWGNGRMTVSSQDGSKLIDGMLARIIGPRRLYQVNVVDNLDDGEVIAAVAGRARNQPTDLETWHRQLGHCDVRVVERMADKSLVDGLRITRRTLRGHCEDCILGKQDRMPFDDDVVHEKEPLERVHLDLWGEGEDGELVGGSVHDAGKETILDAFRTWALEAENQTGYRIKCVRFDLGRKFDNDVFLRFCAERGISMEKVPKASSAANGHVERGNRTVIEGTRTQLIESGLDARFWAEAAAAHCYVRGFIPSSRHPNVIPWVAWLRKKDRDGNLLRLNISHLRAWGSTCWVKDLDHLAGKLGKQGWKGKMVGYMGRRGYRVFDPARSRVYQVRDVIFEEGMPHRTRIVDPEEEPLPHDPSLFDETDQPGPPPSQPASPGTSVVPSTPPTAPNPAPPSEERPVMEIPPLPRRTERIPKPTRAILEAKATEDMIAEARRAKEDWARDNEHPTANAVDVPWDGFDKQLLDSPWAFASAVKAKVPRSYREAMREPEKWLPAMQAEFNQLEQRGVGTRRLTRWRACNQWNARYVARGDEMVEGKDFDTKWAMVARMESVRMVFAVAAVKGLYTRQWDFSGAYLNGKMDRPVYMRQPRGFAKAGEEEKVCKLLRPLYGLTQAGHIWYKELDSGYEDLGYHSNAADPCVRTRIRDGEYTITSTHTDDCLGASTTETEIQRVVAEFAAKWDLKEVDIELLLGLTVEKLSDGSISLSQRQYFEKVLAHFGFADLPPLRTPFPPGYQIRACTSPLSVEDAQFMHDKPFRRILGTLVWGSSGTRPDISLMVGVLRYISGTLDYGLRYSPPTTTPPAPGMGLKPEGYGDSNWAGCVDTRRSTSGYVFFMGGAPTSWAAKRQPIVALSSTEAEYISAARASQQAQWMKNWLSEVFLPQNSPFILHIDNLGAISLTETTKEHGLSKHLDVRWHYIRDLVKDGEIAMESVPGKENVADIFTKALPRVAHERCVRQLGLDWRRRELDARGSVEA